MHDAPATLEIWQPFRGCVGSVGVDAAGLTLGSEVDGVPPLFSRAGFLEPTHARFLRSGEGLQVHDLSAINGVYLSASAEGAELPHGGRLRVGQQWYRFERAPYPEPWGWLIELRVGGLEGSRIPLYPEFGTMGRSGDVLLPEADPFVSPEAAHCAFERTEHGLRLFSIPTSAESLVDPHAYYCNTKCGQPTDDLPQRLGVGTMLWIGDLWLRVAP